MRSKSHKSSGIQALLEGDAVRRAQQVDGSTLYAAVDVIALLADATSAAELWEQIKQREPNLSKQVRFAEFTGTPATSDGLPLEGVFRLIQSLSSPKAERLKTWLAESARDRLLESENPEMLALRARRLYEQKGYSRRWIDKRLRGVSARQEMTSEWYRRGIKQGEQFRELTNQFMRRGFGMDVERYRRYKSLIGTSQNLRDHMSDLELALVALGETVAVGLHQARGSNSFEQLAADSIDAGKMWRGLAGKLNGSAAVQSCSRETICPRPELHRQTAGLARVQAAPFTPEWRQVRGRNLRSGAGICKISPHRTRLARLRKVWICLTADPGNTAWMPWQTWMHFRMK